MQQFAFLRTSIYRKFYCEINRVIVKTLRRFASSSTGYARDVVMLLLMPLCVCSPRSHYTCHHCHPWSPECPLSTIWVVTTATAHRDFARDIWKPKTAFNFLQHSRVQISTFNYMLRRPSCFHRAWIEIKIVEILRTIKLKEFSENAVPLAQPAI